VLELNPDLVGPSIVDMRGIVGEGVRLTVEHLADMRRSTILFHLAKYLLYQKYRDPGEAPKLHLFGRLKAITRQWLEGGYLRCTGGTYPAQLIYQEIADMACERIKAAITETLAGERPVKAILDAYNPTGSTRFVNFTTSKETRWQTDPRKCHINWVVCDSDWEAEFCRVAESHPRVRGYVKNHNLACSSSSASRTSRSRRLEKARSGSRSTAWTSSTRKPGRSPPAAPKASPAGSSTPTITKRVSSSATPTFSARTIPTGR
jgi:type III restriction enzyme